MLTTDAVARLLNAQSPQENGTKELLHQVFLADKNYIIRKPKEPYQTNELNWFISQSRNIKDLKTFAGFIPKIWKEIAEVDGTINSNYGWCCLSEENGSQFEHAMRHLELDKNSRRAIMIYNRPSMHVDWNNNRKDETFRGVSFEDSWLTDREDQYKARKGDFMCCQNNHFIIRDNKLIMTVHMRSLDAVFGYNADYIWFDYIFNLAVQYLKKTYEDLERGEMVIYADSVHVYEMHYKDLEIEASKDYGMFKHQMTKSPFEHGHKPITFVGERNPNITKHFGNQYLKDPENNASVKDMVNHPEHYTKNGIEHWDYVLKTQLGYLLGCATKYLFRSNHKGTKKQDLDKVLTFVDKFIETKEEPNISPDYTPSVKLFHLLTDVSDEVKDILLMIDKINIMKREYDGELLYFKELIHEKVSKLKCTK